MSIKFGTRRSRLTERNVNSEAVTAFFKALLIISVFTLAVEPVASADGSPTQSSQYDYVQLIDSLNLTRISSDIRFFSGLGTRASGYPGNWLAAQYIHDQFQSYELSDLTLQEFDAVDCIDHGSNATFLSNNETITLYSMRPNYVVPSTTPPEGVSGTLVYVHDADPEDLEGTMIQGNIILLDWTAGKRWMNVYRLGAKAAIFLEPNPLSEMAPVLKHSVWNTREQEITTYLEDLPLKFPRFYAPNSVRDALFSHLGEDVVLKSSTYWAKIKSWNIFGVIEGTEFPEQTALIITHYDSYSDAPRYAPGAQEASSIASLLELVRYFASHKPKHSVLFAAVGGYHQNLEGVTQFINDFLSPQSTLAPEVSDLGWVINKNLFWVFDLQLDTGSAEVIWLPVMNGGRETPTAYWRSERRSSRDWYWLEDYVRSLYDDIDTVKPLGKTYSLYIFDDVNWQSESLDLGAHFGWFTTIYDSEPFYLLQEGLNGWPKSMAFKTAYYHKFVNSPYDEFSYVNLQNVQTQLEIVFPILDQFMNADWTTDLQKPEPQTAIATWLRNRDANIQNWLAALRRGEMVSRWQANASGTVGAWDTSVGWYRAVPGALVVLDGSGGDQLNMGDFDVRMGSEGFPQWFRRIVFADENGRYVFKGGMGSEDASITAYWVTGWVIDPSTGDLMYAPEEGIYRFGAPRNIRWGSGIPEFGMVAVFECSQLVTEIYHPNSMTIPMLVTGDRATPTVSMRNEKFEQIDSYAMWNREDLYVLAVPPGIGVKVMVYSPLGRYPFMLYLNSTQQNPEGYGFTLRPGEQRHVPILQGVSDLNVWTSYSFEKITRGLTVESQSAEYLSLPGAMNMLEEAEEAFRAGEYKRYFVLFKDSWHTAAKAYNYFRSKAEGAAATVPFFSLIAVPFTIMAEALFFKLEGKKKVISLVAVFAVQIIALYVFHPGFSIAASPVINVIGFSMLILLLPILGIVVSRVSRFMRTVKIKYVGEHEIDISRMRGSFLPSFKLGLENMKRRKLRTALILMSVMLLVLSVSLFTSLSPLQVAGVTVRQQQPPYEGVVIRKEEWGGGSFDLGERVVDYIEAKYGNTATIAYRVWAYMFEEYRGSTRDETVGNWGYKALSMTTGRNVSLNCLWGLTPQEKDLTGLDGFLVDGRWFLDSEASRPVCILTQAIADEGGFQVGEVLTMAGTNFTVVGILSDDIDFFRDIDHELGMSPIKFDWPEADNPWDQHNDATYYIIIPSKLLLQMGGRVASIAMKPTSDVQIDTFAQEVFDDIDAHVVYYGSGNNVKLLSRRLVFTVFGSEMQIVPSAIVILSLLNMLLGSTYERRKDIGIFSSVGLSPTHIAVQFMAEAATYAIVGTIVGYILSLAVMSYFGVMLGVSLDYSSLNVLMVIAISMGTVMASSLYPAFTASRLVTPSLERTWTPPTTPLADRWEVPLPFTVADDKEATQIINFFKEFLAAHQIPDAEIFSVKSVKKGETKGIEPSKTIHMEMSLAPYDLGVSQRVSWSVSRKATDKLWTIDVVVTRLSGLGEDWKRLALRFIDTARKQVLLWKSMPEEKKRTFS